MAEVPKYLYRGVTVDFDMLYDYNFTGVDIVPHTQYDYIASNGKKMRSDQNEWGVYMSESLFMTKDAYGNPDSGKGWVENGFKVSGNAIKLPCLGIIYEIDSNDIGAREPYMEGSFSGAGIYNNGFGGKEWISDRIPSKNYCIKEAVISNDFLHEKKEFNLEGIDDVKKLFTKEMELRKYRLDTLVTAMKKISLTQRNGMSADMLRDLFGENGVVYMSPSLIDQSNLEGQFKFLMAKIYNKDKENVDYPCITYIHSLKGKYKGMDLSIEEVIGKELATFIEHDEQFYSQNGKHNAFDMGRIKYLEEMKSYMEKKKTPEEELMSVKNSLAYSRKSYNNIATRIENLMKQKQSNPNISVDAELAELIERRDSLLTSMSSDMSSSEYYEDLIRTGAIHDLESTLDIRITDVSGYDVRDNIPIEIKKTVEELTSEAEMHRYTIDRMFYSGKIDKTRYEELKNKISYVYDDMKEKTTSPKKAYESDSYTNSFASQPVPQAIPVQEVVRNPIGRKVEDEHVIGVENTSGDNRKFSFNFSDRQQKFDEYGISWDKINEEREALERAHEQSENVEQGRRVR